MGTSNNFWLWSKTAGSNSNSDAGVNWAEGQTPGSVNDSARGMMAALANFRDDFGAVTTAGAANTFTLTTNTGITALATGLVVMAKINASSTGASTLNVDGLGAKAIRKFTTSGEAAIGSGDLQINAAYVFRYDSALNTAAGGWLCLNPSPGSSGTTSLGGAGRLYGSNASSSNLTDILVGTGLSITGSTLSATGTGGTITQVTAGDGLTGGGTTGAVTVDVGAGSGISVSASTVDVIAPIFAWARVANGGTLQNGYNFSSSKTATGTYSLTFSSSASSTQYAWTCTSSTGVVAGVSGIGTGGFTIVTRSSTSGTAVDAEFSVMVIGG